jgi:hypothetical protein
MVWHFQCRDSLLLTEQKRCSCWRICCGRALVQLEGRRSIWRFGTPAAAAERIGGGGGGGGGGERGKGVKKKEEKDRSRKKRRNSPEEVTY